jgi:hypothetical protein
MTGPAPGSTPRTDPSAVPRNVEAAARLVSPGLGHCSSMVVVVSGRMAGDASVPIISASPNIPIASGMKPMPSRSSGRPIVNLACPLVTSVPTIPSIRPAAVMTIAFSTEPWAMTMAATRPHARSAV